MSFSETIHAHYVANQRVTRLAGHFAELIPGIPNQKIKILDIGCGDGALSYFIEKKRPDIQLTGIDIAPREKSRIPVILFDGEKLPYANSSFDTVLLVDVLHHTKDPVALMREARRVARRSVLIKDHTLDGLFAFSILSFMDRIGNKRYGVPLPYQYWTEKKWRQTFGQLELSVEIWKNHLNLYPWPASLIFDRSLHFIARLQIPR